MKVDDGDRDVSPAGPSSLEDELAACFTGSFGFWQDLVRIGGSSPDPAVVSGRALLSGAVAGELVDRFASAYPGADRRAVVSMWTQWYFGAVVISAMAILARGGRRLPVALDEVGFVFGENGLPCVLVVPELGPVSDNSGKNLSPLLDGNVAPIVARFTELFRVSPRLLWTNAAAALDWAVGELDPEAGESAGRAHREGSGRLRALCDPGGGRNPLLGAVKRGPDAGPDGRCRRVCCLRYLLPGVAGCGGLCPLPGGGGVGAAPG